MWLKVSSFSISSSELLQRRPICSMKDDLFDALFWIFWICQQEQVETSEVSYSDCVFISKSSSWYYNMRRQLHLTWFICSIKLILITATVCGYSHIWGFNRLSLSPIVHVSFHATLEGHAITLIESSIWFWLTTCQSFPCELWNS